MRKLNGSVESKLSTLPGVEQSPDPPLQPSSSCLLLPQSTLLLEAICQTIATLNYHDSGDVSTSRKRLNPSQMDRVHTVSETESRIKNWTHKSECLFRLYSVCDCVVLSSKFEECLAKESKYPAAPVMAHSWHRKSSDLSLNNTRIWANTPWDVTTALQSNKTSTSSADEGFLHKTANKYKIQKQSKNVFYKSNNQPIKC